MIGKILAAIVLLALIGGSVAVATMIPGFNQSTDVTATLMGAVGGGGLVFLLNLIGLGFRPKYFGAIGILISGLILGYGIYVLVTKNTVIPIQHKLVSTVGGVSTGVGAMALLTSTGILTR